MIIILEGTEAVGKTTVARELLNKLPLSMMLKLSGSPKNIQYQEYMQNIYESVMPFFWAVREHNLIIDRFMETERVYARLFKQYEADYINKLEKSYDETFSIKQVLLTATKETLEERLHQKMLESPNEKHADIDTLIRIQNDYINCCTYESQLNTTILEVEEYGTPSKIADRIIQYYGLNKTIVPDSYTTPNK